MGRLLRLLGRLDQEIPIQFLGEGGVLFPSYRLTLDTGGAGTGGLGARLARRLRPLDLGEAFGEEEGPSEELPPLPPQLEGQGSVGFPRYVVVNIQS